MSAEHSRAEQGSSDDAAILRQRLAELEARLAASEQAVDRGRPRESGWDIVFQAIGQPTVILDAEHNILAANQAIASASGQPIAELIGKKCWEVFHSASATASPDGCPLEKMRRSGRLETVEMEMAAFGGIYLVSCTPVLDDDGRLDRIIHISTDISEQKRTERALRESERQMYTLIQNLPGFVYRCENNRNWTMLFISDGCQGVTGYASAELLADAGLSYNELIHPDDQQRIWKETQGCLQRREAFQLEYRIVTRDGDVRWVWEHGCGVFDDGGAPTCLEGYICDVTDPVLSRKALATSEARLRQAQSAAGIGVWDSDLQDDTYYCSDSYLLLYGLPAGSPAPTYEQWLDLVHPEDRNRIHEEVSATLTGGAPHDSEYRILRPSGEARWLASRAQVIRDQRGQPVRMIGVSMDITDRKRAEQDLLESERRFRVIFEQAAVGVAQIETPTGRFVRVNQKYCDIVGLTPEQMTATTFMALTHPDDLQEDLDNIERLKAGEIHEFTVQKRYIRPDGPIVWVNLTVSPLWSQGQPPDYHIAVVEDIAERVALEEQLRHSQKMEAVGQLAGGVAHDFNNILTAIFGNVELALGRLGGALPASDPLLECMRQIDRGAQRAADLTRQLLAFSRRQVARPRVIDLNRALHDTERMIRRLLTENISLEVHRAAALPAVRVDPGQIEQVIVNLVVNARDAMPDGGHLTLETQAVRLDESYVAAHADARLGPHAVLAVSDTGRGMDPPTRACVFEPFFTTKNQGQGTGLGLATVYGIVKQSGGHITVYSEPGRGTSFKVYLPAVDEPLDRHTDASAAVALGGAETILLCEDDKSVRNMAVRMLESAGYTVLSAENGAQARGLSRTWDRAIHLLLTDVVMPDTNGKELASALTADRGPDLEVLYVSGYTANVIAHHGVLEEGVEFLEKPFSRTDLLRRVRELLDRRARTT